jgi:tetratricopeptide (TPR) repeat protein
MNPMNETGGRMSPPSLDELFTRYLQRQAIAQAEGLGFAPPTDEVVPHEAVPAQPVDPRQAWEDAVTVLPYLDVATHPLAVLPDWPTLVAAQEPAVAVAFCLGNYPQLVRHLHPLLGDLPAVRATPSSPLPCSALEEWGRRARSGEQAVVAAAALRLAGHFDQAEELLRSASVPAFWGPVRANEEAALSWHRGQAEEALARWQSQEERIPVLFNRGMAALFLDRPDEAAAALGRAVEQLPETSAWHHLGQLYLALARSRTS